MFTPKRVAVAKGAKQPKVSPDSSARTPVVAAHQSPITPAASSPVASAGLTLAQLEPVDSINALHYAEVQSAMDVILAHPTFTGIMSEGPLPLGESSIAPFSKAEFELSIGSGKYNCGYNMFQLSLLYTPGKGVPVNRRGARSLGGTLPDAISSRRWHFPRCIRS